MKPYDPSTDYARYPTLAPLPEELMGSYARCESCGGAEFRLLMPQRKAICAKCGGVFEESNHTSETPSPKLEKYLPVFKFQIVSISSLISSNIFVLRPDGTIRSYTKLPRSLSEIEGWTQIVFLSAGNKHIAGLRSDGTVTVAGLPETEQTTIQSWSGITSIAATGNGVVGLRGDGTVCAVGVKPAILEQLNKWTSVTSISARGNQIVAVRSDGTLRAAGNVSGEIYGWDQITAVAMGVYTPVWNNCEYVLGLRRSGHLISTTFPNRPKMERRKDRDIRAIAASGEIAAALKKDETIEIIYNTTGNNKVLAVSKWRRIQAMWVCGGFVTALRDDGFIHCTDPEIQRFIVEALD